MCAFTLPSLCVCACEKMRKRKTHSNGAVGRLLWEEGGNNHQRKPKWDPAPQTYKWSCVNSWAPTSVCRVTCPESRCFCCLSCLLLCFVLPLGWAKGRWAFLLHVVWLQGSDCTCETDTAIKLRSNILWIEGFAFCCVFVFVLCCFLLFYLCEEAELLDFPYFCILLRQKMRNTRLSQYLHFFEKYFDYCFNILKMYFLFFFFCNFLWWQSRIFSNSIQCHMICQKSL